MFGQCRDRLRHRDENLEEQRGSSDDREDPSRVERYRPPLRHILLMRGPPLQEPLDEILFRSRQFGHNQCHYAGKYDGLLHDESLPHL